MYQTCKFEKKYMLFFFPSLESASRGQERKVEACSVY